MSQTVHHLNRLYDLRYRQYDPLLRVFLSPDPLGYAASGFDLWLYVGGDPLNFIDPIGLKRGKGLGAEPPRMNQHMFGLQNSGGMARRSDARQDHPQRAAASLELSC